MQGYSSQQFLTQLRSTEQQQLPPLSQLQQLSQPLPQQPPQPRQQQPSQPQPQQPSQPQPQQPSQPRQQQPSQPQHQRTAQPPQRQPPQQPARQRGASLIQRLRQQLLRRRRLQATTPRIRPVEATGLLRRPPRRQHQLGNASQSPPESSIQSTGQQGPEPTSVRKVTLQLAAWKLHRLDIPPPARTRPPRYCLYPWDLRVRRYTSPRYLQAPPPAGQQEPSSGSEWETTNQPGDENANYWGPVKRTATQPSLTYCERVSAKRRTTKWTHTQPPLTYKDRSPSK
ncbi:PREDICTED: mediator of RNA polymerase II transcription subunit 15-like [Cyphomyrmex costatus]|uniref:mediator of RNA polymerase II transcription subunit 15-like n=1 Tax=Cyphomyrmex costatus TaxID=456900 RepID=UPI0008523A19|nr:PREDICTED: mediator of RNA polymerase II transcription subunit 15-like [Cyphomyrmex costatus]XP_018403702.1 PREDICTED: mediator of RNA polymerase II transcription subunit 15-like [Cyphomyrmex costatus]XP_018403703.1 PREDICTED: mediator of RNA polymerase II transcription subunit 15-like [Cyphomyrmex costatus]